MTVRTSEVIECDVCRRFTEGEDPHEFAPVLGLTVPTVYRILRRRGVPCRKAGFNLDREQCRAIVDRYLAGESSITLSRELGVCERFITRTLKRAGATVRDPIEAHHNRNPGLDETVFDTITEESAYWIGMLITDGCIFDKDKQKAQTRIVLALMGEDQEHVDRFRSFVGTATTAKTRIVKRVKRDGSRSTVCRLSISSNHIAEALAKYGVVPRKSLTATVIGLEDNRDFWRGVIDGDGYLTYTHKDSPSPCPVLGLTGSSMLVSQFSIYCYQVARVGPIAIRKHLQGNCYQIGLHGNNACNMARILYSKATVSLARKKELADEFIRCQKKPHVIGQLTLWDNFS